jgi:hypothetical protein
MALYLWKLTAPITNSIQSDRYDEFVVAAESAAAAREIVAKHGCGRECGKHSPLVPTNQHKRCVWSDRQKTDCTRIGIAEPKLAAGVVCSSYYSG